MFRLQSNRPARHNMLNGDAVIGVAVQFVLKCTISLARKINRLESDKVSFFNSINGFLRFLAMSPLHLSMWRSTALGDGFCPSSIDIVRSERRIPVCNAVPRSATAPMGKNRSKWLIFLQ